MSRALLCPICGIEYSYRTEALRCALGHGEPVYVRPEELYKGDRIVLRDGVCVVHAIEKVPSSAPWRVLFTWGSPLATAIQYHDDALVEVLR